MDFYSLWYYYTPNPSPFFNPKWPTFDFLGVFWGTLSFTTSQHDKEEPGGDWMLHPLRDMNHEILRGEWRDPHHVFFLYIVPIQLDSFPSQYAAKNQGFGFCLKMSPTKNPSTWKEFTLWKIRKRITTRKTHHQTPFWDSDQNLLCFKWSATIWEAFEVRDVFWWTLKSFSRPHQDPFCIVCNSIYIHEQILFLSDPGT